MNNLNNLNNAILDKQIRLAELEIERLDKVLLIEKEKTLRSTTNAVTTPNGTWFGWLPTISWRRAFDYEKLHQN